MKLLFGAVFGTFVLFVFGAVIAIIAVLITGNELSAFNVILGAAEFSIGGWLMAVVSETSKQR